MNRKRYERKLSWTILKGTILALLWIDRTIMKTSQDSGYQSNISLMGHSINLPSSQAKQYFIKLKMQ
jgi:hypothetical protein